MNKQSPKRILLVDNDLDVLHSVSLNLMAEGYTVLTASNVFQARQLLRVEIIHLLIVDRRLENNDDPNDASGCALALERPAYRFEPEFPSRAVKIPCIVFTAYHDIEAVHEAWQAAGADAIVNKREPGSAKMLVAAVQKALDNLALNPSLDVDGTLRLEQVALQIEVPISETPEPNEDDVRHILQILFHDATKVNVTTLMAPEQQPTESQSGSVLLRARPQFGIPWGNPVVVKLAAQIEVDHEARNYQRIIPFLGGNRVPQLYRVAYSRRCGGLSYRLLGAGKWDSIHPFSDKYFEMPTPTLVKLIQQFFEETFRDLYFGAQLDTLDLAADYASSLGLSAEKLHQVLYQFRADAWAVPQLAFRGNRDRFPNPILWAMDGNRFKPQEALVRVCLCHGDLHGRNILVDGDGNFWLIDFARVAASHALRDFVELESDIKFNLMRTVDLDALWRMELNLLTPSRFADGYETFDGMSDDLQRAYQVIIALRQSAARLLHLGESIREYYLALFYHTLNAIRLHHIIPAKKEYALMSAAMLCQRIDQLNT